jgi:hypothetical protein
MRGYDPRAPRRMVADMGAVLFAMVGPTVVFGLFALLAVRYGAESRPYFDERPVVDDRPNWFPIARAGRDDDEDDEPLDGEPMPAAEPRQTAPDERAGRPARPRRQPATVPLASASNAATSPSGV